MQTSGSIFNHILFSPKQKMLVAWKLILEIIQVLSEVFRDVCSEEIPNVHTWAPHS